jgi:hypothetical protein
MFRRFLNYLLVIQALTACNAWRNNAEQVSVECGIPRNTIGKQRYVKILESDGSSFVSSEIRSLKTYFQRDSSDTGFPLPITDHGCLILPDEKGIVHVLDSKNSESVSFRSVDGLSASSLSYLKLQPKQEILSNLACPEEGIFAGNFLEQPLMMTFAGDATGLDVRLDLFSATNSYISTIFRKPLGEKELNLPSKIPFDHVSEGKYILKAYGHHVSEGLPGKPRLLNPDKTCSLIVLRGEVKVESIDVAQSPVVYPHASQLPWSPGGPYESLYFCSEPRLNRNSSMTRSESCEASLQCRDRASFKKVPFVKADKAGVFDYFVYSENKLGQRSPTICKTVIVSDQAPNVSIAWRHDDLQKDGAILRKPYAILQADIEANHSLLAHDEIAMNLSCKVEFEIKGRHTFLDQNVICTEGRCKGKSLSNFVPCDKSVSFTMVDSLDQSMLLFSRLILKVRADDGAGHISEAEKSLWINQSTWQRESLEFKVGNTAMRLDSYLIDSAGNILATFGYPGSVISEFVAVYRDNSWSLLNDGIRCQTCNFKISKTRDKTILVARVGPARNDVYRYQNLTLETITAPDNQIPLTKCLNFLGGLKQDAYCTDQLNNNYYFSDGVWRKLPPAFETTGDASPLAEWRVLSDGRLIGTAEAVVYISDNQNWKKIHPKAPGSDARFHIYEDFKGRVWLYAFSNSSSFIPTLNLLVNNELVPYPSTIPFDSTQPRPRTQSTSLGGLSSLVVGFQRFDFNTDTWSTLNYPLSSSEGLALLSESNKNFIATANKGFFEVSGELLYWPLKALGFPCTIQCDSIERDEKWLYFEDTSKEAHTLVRLKAIPISSFNSQMLGIRDSYSPGQWMNTAGELTFAFADGLELTLLKDRVLFGRLPLSDQTVSTVQLPSGKYCIQTWSGLYLHDRSSQAFSSIWNEGMGRANYCTQDAAGNLWWMNTVDHILYRYDGRTPEPMANFGKSIGEELVSIFSLPGTLQIVVATSHRIVMLNADGIQAQSYSLLDIADDQEALKILKAAKISDVELFIEIAQSSKERLYFTLNTTSGEIKADKVAKQMIGKHLLQQIKSAGATGYLLTKNPDATVLQRKAGKWEVLATFDDMRPFLIRKVQPPYQLMPDPYGRIWLHTTAPNNLLRLDP